MRGLSWHWWSRNKDKSSDDAERSSKRSKDSDRRYFLQAPSAMAGSGALAAMSQPAEAKDASELPLVSNPARGIVDTPELKLIGGMHGAKWYAKLSDRFEMERPTWANWGSPK